MSEHQQLPDHPPEMTPLHSNRMRVMVLALVLILAVLALMAWIAYDLL